MEDARPRRPRRPARPAADRRFEAWQGRGIYKALVARRAQLAVARGIEYLQVDASEDSRPILERLGFTAITHTTPYIWSP